MNNQIIKTYIEERAWGKFERFTQNEESTIKIITIKAGEKLSLQSHEFRNEFWRILSGEGKVTIGEDVMDAKKGDEFFISIGTKHRAEGINEELVFLEIAFGHSDEGDVIRLEDKYGRQN